jgi:hypothetical protein
MWSTSHVSDGRRNARVARKRRCSFNIPMVSAKFTFLILRLPGTRPVVSPVVAGLRSPGLFNNRRERLDNFENTSRWQILQWSASE